MRAHAPGSVTVLFAPVEDGAHGVSFATEDGVVAAVEPADETVVTLDGEPTDFEPVELALADLGVDAKVDLTAEVPVGRGFGASGAATLAAVLAADARLDLGYERDALVGVAASAEIAAGTGLGDVYVQERGGLVWNVGDGREHRERTDPVEYASFGGIATEDVLDDDEALAAVSAAAEDAFPRFDPGASLPALFDVAWTFARSTGLATDRVQEAVERVGGGSTMAMVGETVVAAGTDGAVPERTRITPTGARVLEE